MHTWSVVSSITCTTNQDNGAARRVGNRMWAYVFILSRSAVCKHLVFAIMGGFLYEDTDLHLMIRPRPRALLFSSPHAGP